MMKMMMKVVLLLVLVFSVSTDILHEGVVISGCSDSDGESWFSLDGEVGWFADFKNNKGVETQPRFIDYVPEPEGLFQLAEVEQHVCKDKLERNRETFKDFPVEYDPPSTPVIFIRDYVDLGQKNSLICHVTGFYPAPVKIYWTKNEENMTEGTGVNLPYVNKDGTFNQFSRLEFTPQLGDIYSCTVRHVALETPLSRLWDVETSQPSVGPAVFCGLGLMIGLLGVAAGTFFLIKGNECSLSRVN